MQSTSDAVKNALVGAVIHETWENVYRNSRSERLYDPVFDWIAQCGGVPAGSRWLDIGCGIGRHAIRLRRRKYNVVAADFSPDRVQAAREYIRQVGMGDEIILQCEDLVAGLSFPAAAFDAVLCWGVLMHIPLVETAMMELIRVTKPKGKLFICEGNIHGVDATISCLASWARRAVGKSRYKQIVMGPYGREYWVRTEAGDLVIRHTRMSSMASFFEQHGCRLNACICGEFTEWYSRGGALGRLLHAWNEIWFRRVRSPYLAHGNLLVLEKLD